MAIDGHFLQGVRVHASIAHPSDIGDPQAELAGSILEGLLAIAFRDFPEDIGPLGITR